MRRTRQRLRPAILVVAVTAGFSGAAPAAAQDIEAGGALYKTQCRSCHGPTAKGMASYPKLTGKSVDHLVDRLRQYRAGRKVGPNTPLMAPRARKLSDDDIVNITTYIVTTFE